MTDDDHKDPKVKELVERDPSQPLERFVDAATAAQLERWFGLPSFAQVAAGEAKLVEVDEEDLDPEQLAVRERRRRVLENVDPEFLAAFDRRRTPPPDLIKFAATIEPIDTSIALFDVTPYLPKAKRPKEDGDYEGDDDDETPSDQRHYDIPEDIQEALKENTPQALLRDLHRLEVDFDQPIEDEDNMQDETAPEPYLVNIHEKIDEAMTMRFRVAPNPPLDVASYSAEFRTEVRRSWADIANSGQLYNRRVTE